MGNELDDKSSPLSRVSYKPFYEIMGQYISELDVVDRVGNVFFAKNLYRICSEVVEKLSPKLSNRFFVEMQMDETAIYGNTVTINFKDKEQEHDDLNKLFLLMKEALQAKNILPKTDKLEDIITKDSSGETGSFSVKMQNQTKRASFGKLEYNAFDEVGKKNILRHDDVKISYRVDNLMESIKQSLIRCIEGNHHEDDAFKEMVIEQIRSENILADTIYTFIERNRFAAVKRASSFLYLDYLLSNMDTEFLVKYKESISWLKRYVERYDRLEELCTQFLKEIRYESVEILGEPCDILNTLRNDNVYEFLPFIGRLSSVMAATRSENKNIEQYGVSLKLNGKVQNTEILEGKGELSFTYHAKKLIDLAKNGNDEKYFETHKEMANRFWYGAIRVVLLKYFLLHLDDEMYDPSIELREDLDRIVNYNGSLNQEDAHAWYREIAKTLFYTKEYRSNKISSQLEKIREMLCTYLDPKLNRIQQSVQTKTYKRRMTFLKSILEPKLFQPDRASVLRNELDTHNYKYTILTKEILEDSLFSFEYEIEFSNTFLCSTHHQERIEFQYDISEKDKSIEVMFLPVNEMNKIEKRVSDHITEWSDLRKICIPYPKYDEYPPASVEQFIFLFSYKLFVYVFLTAYTDELKEHGRNLFIGFWHFHQQVFKDQEYTRMEQHIRQFTKELEFLFGMNYNTGSQGYDLGTGNTYKSKNARHSMYSNVPKTFAMDVPIRIPKIAIIVITSRKSDDRKRSDQYRTGVFGEVYVIDSQIKTSKLRRFCTFFDHHNETVYQHSDVLVSIMQKLSEIGYKHILYIARTPYTTKFLDKKNNQKELYFMNQELMESLHITEDMSVYPIHFTLTKAYEARLGKQNQKVALFVDDTSHIQKNLYQDHEGIIPILQLYSGNGLKENEQRHVYNSLITYQTWSRIYSDEVINNKIQSAVIDPDGIKPDLIRALLLLHTSRFESYTKITIKVDPYSRLLGDEGIAKKSLVDISLGKKSFSMNMLAYFSYLQTKVVNKEERMRNYESDLSE
jgi:hypothetical protein